MRFSVLLSLAGLLDVTFAAAALGRSTGSGYKGVHWARRGFDGFHFLGGLDEKSTGGATYHFATDTPTHTADGLSPTSSASLATTTDTSPGTDTKKKAKETELVPTGTSYSVIGTIPPLDSHSIYPAHSSATNSGQSSPTSSSATAVAAASSNGGGGGGTSEWKIIGVAVIAFSVVAAILLLSVFFDHWWRFVRDLVWRRRPRSAGEELVPDWEKAQWELRGKDMQRYPSFTSLPSLPVVQTHIQGDRAQIQSPPQAVIGRTGRSILAHGRAPARHLDGGAFETKSPSYSQIPRSTSGYAGVGTVGLGLGRMGSAGRTGQTVSPQIAGVERSPTSQHTTRFAHGNPFDDVHSPSVGSGNGKTNTSSNTNTRGGGNPFDDVPSPMPADIYGGMAD